MNQIKYVDYNTSHLSDFVFDIPEGHDCWLLISTHTPAVFYVDGNFKEYPPNCAVLYKPNQKIYYRACGDTYSDDWIRFESNEIYVTTTPLPSGVPFILSDPTYCHKLYQLLVTEHIMNNNYKEISIDNLLKLLFSKLLESYNYKPVSPLYKNLYELKKEIYRNPSKNWTVAQMAANLNISIGYLADIYKKTFGITCMDDVINARINLAKKYLLYDSYTIGEIVTLCGYQNVEHFFRQFKKMTGTTPNCYRNNCYKSYHCEDDPQTSKEPTQNPV